MNDEIIERLRRIETKVHRVATHVGADANPPRVQVTETGGGLTIDAVVEGMDFTLAQLCRACETANIAYGGRLVMVRTQDGSLLAQLRLTARG